MDSLLALAAPLALLLPLVGEAFAMRKESAAEPGADAQCDAAALAGEGGAPALLDPLSALRQSSIARQVRIEQRVIIRITPQPSAVRQNLLAEARERQTPSRFEERAKEKCVSLGEIASVQTGSGNRLVFFLRDRRLMSVALEKSCRARDFYSGFYVEKSKDGRLCTSRDKLQSRTGAQCEVEVMRQLVEVRE